MSIYVWESFTSEVTGPVHDQVPVICLVWTEGTAKESPLNQHFIPRTPPFNVDRSTSQSVETGLQLIGCSQRLDVDIMSTISTQLRNFKEPSKEQLLHLFFSIPELPITSPPDDDDKHSASDAARMDINAVLSFGEHGVEDSYVSLFAAISSPGQVNGHCATRQGNCISSHHI
jgi:hypothetical protein